YKVRVITGKESRSGTTANVTLTIYGQNGRSQTFPLKHKNESFKKGSENIFFVTAEDLGNISNIKIAHDDQGKNPSWFLEMIIIEESGTGKIFRFPCGDWISSDDGGKTFRYLSP
ncbi:hypothetical protein CAPTEDRAFT_57238, partial [Capitella teleta]